MKRLERARRNNRGNTLAYERTKKEVGKKHRMRSAPFAILVLTCGLFYLLFLSEVFLIKEIKVSGYGNPDSIKNLVNDYIQENRLKKNIFLFDGGPVKEAIKKDGGILEVSIAKLYPDTLSIKVLESRPVLVWGSGGEYFEIDDRGYVIKKNKPQNLPIVYDSSNITPSLGERVASPTFINYVSVLKEEFGRVTGAKPEKIFIYDLLTDVRVKSNYSWTAYLNARKDPKSQLENLNKVLSATKNNGKGLEYIDLRHETRIFYR